MLFQANQMFVFAQRPRLQFKYLKVKDGLSQSWVKSICQDQYGFIWFGTDNGLNRYDGYTFKIYKYNPKDNTSLSNNSIERINEDRNGNLWIATQGGLNLYDRNNDRFIFHSHWPRAGLNDLAELEDGRLLLTSNESGIYIYAPETDTYINYTQNDTTENSISSNNINTAIQDRNGYIWIGAANGLNLFDPKSEQFTLIDNTQWKYRNLSGNNIRSLYEDSKGNIWVGTWSNGLNLLRYSENPVDCTFRSYKNDPEDPTSLGTGTVAAIQEDRNGYLWISTENDGLNLLDLKNFHGRNAVFYHYKHDPSDNTSLSNNSVYSLFQDNCNSMWIGTYGDGINMYNRLNEKFIHYKQKPSNINSLSNNFVYSFLEEGNLLWIGTEKGLNRYNQRTGQFRHYIHDPNNSQSIGSNAAIAVFRDKRQNMWVGTWAGGLNLMNTKEGTFAQFKMDDNNPSSIGANNIFSMTEDSKYLWLGTMGGGLNRYDYQTGSFKIYRENPEDPSTILNDWVNFLFEDSHGYLWIASQGGVDVFNKMNESFWHVLHDTSDQKSISSDDPTFFHEDSKRQIWIGTKRGLNVFNREDSSFHYYTEEQGLPNNQVNGILEDDHGNLWISTNRGLTKFINGIEQPENPVFKNYTVSDGLQGDEYNQRSCYKGKDGRMYFGGTNGFNVFHPDSIKENTFIPPIVISDFLLFNKPVHIGEEGSPLIKHINETDELVLSYKQSVLTFEFAALNYISPEKNEYSYYLEGFDKEWNNVGTKRVASYTNLDPGKYTLRIRGSNNDGLWNEDGKVLRIVITPPFWQTGWFRIILILVILGSASGGIYWYTSTMRKRNEELEAEVAKRTDELKKQKEEIELSYKKMADVGRRLELSSRQASAATGQIDQAMQEMADGSETQTNHVDNMKQVLDDLITTLYGISREAQRSAKVAGKTATAISSGLDTMHQSFDSMQRIEQNVENTFNIMEKVARHSGHIDQIVDMIQDIASRVNVLGLNASIEATKAGETATGFAVVATEIRQLSKSASESAKKITDLVGAMQADIQQVERVISEGMNETKQSVQLTNKGRKSLNQILTSIEDEHKRLNTVASKIMSLSNFSHEVETAMNGVSDVSLKNNQTVQEVTTSTQEMNQQMKDLASMAQTLGDLSKK